MRMGCRVRPQSSWIGPGRERNCVSTVPTDPAAALGAGVAMREIIPPPSSPLSWPLYDPELSADPFTNEGVFDGYDDGQQRSQRPGAVGCAGGVEGRA